MDVVLLLVAAVVQAQGLPSQATVEQHRGLYSRHSSEFEVTYPQKVSPGGEPLGDTVTHHHTGRSRRSTRDVPSDTLHYKMRVAGRTELLDLEPSDGFISASLRTRRGPRVTACHYRGVVRGHRTSTVALSACDGLVGVLRINSTEYWLEPSASSNTTAGRPHILFRRAAATRHRKRKKKKRKKKHEKNCGTKEPARLPTSRLEWASVSGVGRVRGRRRGRVGGRGTPTRTARSVSRERYVEALLVADASMVEFHSDGDVEMYLLTIMNMVSALYQEPSIGNSVNIVVVRIMLIEDDAVEGLNITVNADSALSSFCAWQHKQNPSTDLDPQHHDVAILVTRKDICARQDRPCSTLGVAHVGGMCQLTRSCNINEDNGITLAHTIAHELGHNFGMFHDSAKSGCMSRHGPTLHVMTPIFEADSLHIAWSECSRRDITHFLDEGSGGCLEDRPELSADYSYPELPPGAMYNADYQCRLQFGPESSACSSEEICSRLWCKVDGMCTTNLYPAAPGTHCDKHMWCVNQACVSIGESALPIAGGWGEWGQWSPCSRSCGAGVSVKERLCDHPSPAFGGPYCLGERRKYKICNTKPCPESLQRFRAQQCSAYNDQPYFGKNYTWLPYFESSEPCELYCTDSEDTIIASLGDAALDGTPCNLGTRDMCVSGICRKVGCDWLVDSDAVEDKCGVCQGDGKLCTTQKGYYNITSGDGYTEVAVFPKGARNIRVEELSSSRNYIGIGSAAGSTFYLNGNGEITIAGEYLIAGSAALYERHKELEKVRIPGPIKEDILVYVIFRDDNPGVFFEFTLPNEKEEQTADFKWHHSDWSTCSATCGGGEQVSRAICKETIKDVTATGKCPEDLRPSDMMRTCNLQPCPVRWWIGPWQHCPVTCGERALQRRTVLCVSGRHELALPDSECAGQSRPHDTEPCPDIPPCLLAPPRHSPKRHRHDEVMALGSKYEIDKWTVLPWSQCSVTCGIGFKKRTVFCSSQKCDAHTKPISVKQCFRHCQITNM